MPTRAPDEEVLTLAREILERDAYARWLREPAPPDRLSELLDRLATLPSVGRVFDALERLRERLGELFEWLRALLGAEDPTAGWIFQLAGLLVVLAALAYLARAAASALSQRTPSGEAAREPEPPPLGADAAGLAAEGRFLEAAHLLALASIELLVHGGVVALARHDANTTLRRRVAGSALAPGERERFLELLDRLERLWFRDRRAERSLYDDWRRLYARLERLRLDPAASAAELPGAARAGAA